MGFVKLYRPGQAERANTGETGVVDRVGGSFLSATTDFIVRGRTARSVAEQAASFQALVRPLGFEYVTIVDAPRAGSDPASSVRFTTLKPDWIDDFVRNRRDLTDPVWTESISSGRAFQWSTILAAEGRDEADASVVFRRLGLADGFTVPVYSSKALRSIVFLGALRPFEMDSEIEAMLTIATGVLVARMDAARPSTRPRGPLTDREREVLGWTAAGLSARDIGVILSMSEKTVARHLLNIRGKLSAANTVQAVALAIREGLISS